MKKFKITSQYAYNEIQVTEQNTEKTFTLTQKATLFTSDYYSVYRFIAVDNEYNNTPEPDSYVYQFSFLCSGCISDTIIVDEQTAKQFISDNLLSFIQGKINSNIFQEYLQKHLTT